MRPHLLFSTHCRPVPDASAFRHALQALMRARSKTHHELCAANGIGVFDVKRRMFKGFSMFPRQQCLSFANSMGLFEGIFGRMRKAWCMTLTKVKVDNKVTR